MRTLETDEAGPIWQKPVHPGEVLREKFLEPLGLNQNQLARALGVPPQRISAIIRGKKDITPETALRLAKYFGTTPFYWLNLQSHYDIEKTKEEKVWERIDKEVKQLDRWSMVSCPSKSIPTYKVIQRETKERFKFLPKTCWIAHTKEVMGFPVRRAPNRRGSGRGVPCPRDKMDQIREVITSLMKERG